MSRFKNKKIVVILSGSIACFKAATLISQLVKQGAEVKTVTTKSALKFLGEATLEGLTGSKNHSDLFESGQMMEHIHLARWADMMVVYPATANFMAKVNLGLASDISSTLLLAVEPHIPVFMAPAMNQAMWSNPTTRSHVESLKAKGIRILEPESGRQACGEVGDGRLIEPENALEKLKATLPQPMGKVLITYGGTVENIDSVRAITNFSSGLTGKTLCEQLMKRGWDVHAVHSKSAETPSGINNTTVFGDFQSLDSELKEHLSHTKFDAVIHLAAVSDYSVDKVVDSSGKEVTDASKISTDGDISLILKKNFKILNRLKVYSSNKSIQVIGFKLTVGADSEVIREKVSSVFKGGGVDHVVQNDLMEIAEIHPFKIWDLDLNIVKSGQSKLNLAIELHEILKQKVKPNDNKEVTL